MDDTENITLPVARNDGERMTDNITSNAEEQIIPARYLTDDEDIEAWMDRVSKNIALAEACWTDADVWITPPDIKPDHPRRDELIAEVFGEDPDPDATVRLTEDNVSKVSYDTMIDSLPTEAKAVVEEQAEAFRDAMAKLQFLPNTPTLMNAGDELQQLSACFVLSPEDDIEDIHSKVNEAAQIFQSGGGCGYAFSNLRPYGDAVGSTGGIASGPITFMHTFDQMCETIAQGGTRRGAQMGILSIDHPDVIEFIHAKNKDVSLAHSLRLNDPDDYTYTTFAEALDEARELIDSDGRVPKHLRNAVEGHLSNFNISVGLTDDFVEAWENDDEYELINPRTDDTHIATEHTKEMWSRYGLGDEVEVGEPLRIPARKIMDRLVEGAHQNGEPGWVHLDRINQEHSFDVDEHPDKEIISTNPCGEQPLMQYEACNLGHINLSTVVAEDAPDWREWRTHHSDTELDAGVAEFVAEAIDIEELERRVELGTRFLDNVVTMSDFPIPEIEESVKRHRKIGLGIMGLAQLYIQVGMEYGSPAANSLGEELMRIINQHSKAVSHDLAQDRGCFPEWHKSKYARPMNDPEWFRRQTGFEALAEHNRGGFAMRNHNTTTVAPTGTTSMVGNTTGGCEPIYNVAHYKNVSDDVQGDDMLVEFDSYFLHVLEHNGIDVEAVKQEAQEQMKNNAFAGVDGLDTVPDAIGELFVTTSDLSATDHAGVQCALQTHVDSAISKTINFPHSATRDEVEAVFGQLIKNGAKGATVYRDGTRSKQVLTTRAENTDFADADDMDEADAREAIHDLAAEFDLDVSVGAGDEGETKSAAEAEQPTPVYAEKRDRPDELHGTTQRIDTGYGKIYVNINEDSRGQPFELFANIGNSGGFTNSFTEALAKTISTALRSGVDPEEIAHDLQGIRSPQVAWDNSEQIDSVPDAIGVALQRWLDSHAGEPIGENDGDGDGETDDGVWTPATEAVDEFGEAAPDAEADGGSEIIANPDDENDAQRIIQQGDNPECPDCGGMLSIQESCKTCESCGWSEC